MWGFDVSFVSTYYWTNGGVAGDLGLHYAQETSHTVLKDT